MWAVILMAMIFCHIVDDYYLQGCLAKFKQKQWWKDNVKNYEKYKHDYIIALLMHGFSWAFMIHVPILWYAWNFDGMDGNFGYAFVFSVLLNTVDHASIDHEKANKLSINLCQDQIMHMYQIIITWLAYCGYFIM